MDLAVLAPRPTNSRPLELVVVDTSQKEDVIVNEELVRLGFAKFAGPVPGVKTHLHKGQFVNVQNICHIDLFTSVLT